MDPGRPAIVTPREAQVRRIAADIAAVPTPRERQIGLIQWDGVIRVDQYFAKGANAWRVLRAPLSEGGQAIVEYSTGAVLHMWPSEFNGAELVDFRYFESPNMGEEVTATMETTESPEPQEPGQGEQPDPGAPAEGTQPGESAGGEPASEPDPGTPDDEPA